MGYKEPDCRREQVAIYYSTNKEQIQSQKAKRYKDIKRYSIDSIINGKIDDKHKWDLFCNKIKKDANNNRHPYSEEFTNDIMFEMMLKGCFYCRDVATTIDRIDSTLCHTIDNCIGCCHACNISKGVSDPTTFIRKAYYRTRNKYVDDTTDIWVVLKQKPIMWNYIRSANKQGIPFELTKQDWNIMTKSDCKYCKRSPTTWFGIDRIIPSKGYVIENVVSCCFDCNVDKHVNDIDVVKKRNEFIANRVDTGELVIKKCPQVVLHQGINKTSQKVCTYGKVYANKMEASRALGKCNTYVKNCMKRCAYKDDIFDISDEFYDEYKDIDMYITKTMYVGFEHFYVNE